MTRPIPATIEFKLVLKNYQRKNIQTSFIFKFSFLWIVFRDIRARFPSRCREIVLTRRMHLLDMNVQFLNALWMEISIWIRPQVLRCLDTIFTCIFLPHSRHAIRWFLFISLSKEKTWKQIGCFKNSHLISFFSLLSRMNKNQRIACLECGRKIHVKSGSRYRKTCGVIQIVIIIHIALRN